MRLSDFSKANVARCENADGFAHPLDDWTALEWAGAMVGEAGEAANAAKKMKRHESGLRGNVKAVDDDYEGLKRKTAEEAADAIAYADLLIQSLGFDTDEVLRYVFNRKSVEVGYPLELCSDGVVRERGR